MNLHVLYKQDTTTIFNRHKCITRKHTGFLKNEVYMFKTKGSVVGQETKGYIKD